MKKFKLFLIGILLSSTFTMFAQQTVKGVVKEKSSGEVLPGVSVVVNGPTRGVATDFDGNFTIERIKTGDILVFRYLGYANTEVTIGTNYNITVILDESSEQLDEIVVVGYGTQRKKETTGAVSVVDAAAIEKLNPTRVEQALQGQIHHYSSL